MRRTAKLLRKTLDVRPKWEETLRNRERVWGVGEILAVPRWDSNLRVLPVEQATNSEGIVA